MTYLKENNLLMFVLSLCIGLVMVIGCEGPEGPQGPAGPEGPQGPQGDQGPQGEEGTANVIYSDWTDFDDSNWSSLQNDFGIDYRGYPVSVPELDSAMAATGVVKVYVSFVCCTDIDPLPVVIDNDSKVRFQYEEEEIQIRYQLFPDASGDPGTFGSGNRYRYVLIPGGQSASKTKNYEKMSYEELQQRFNIPDEGSGVIRNVRTK